MKPKDYFRPVGVVVTCKKERDFLPVTPGLAVTPSQMLELSEHGIAISGQNAANFDDGEFTPSWDLDASQLRGVDMADLWQLQRSTKKKMRQAYAADVMKYGDANILPSEQ